MTPGVSDTEAPVVLGEWVRSGTTEPGPACDGPRLLEQPIRRNRKAAPVADILTPRPANGQHPRRSLRDRWRVEVIRSPHITDSTRVLLLVLADDMREDGYVSVPRDQLAERLDRTERKVSQRLADAVEARLLDRVVRGQKGRTAVYRAVLRVTGTSTLNGSQGDGSQHPEKSGNRHPESTFRVTPGGPASTKSTTSSASSRKRERPGSTSELPSLRSEKRSAEVDVRGTSRHRQEREEGEPVLLGVVLEGLFGKRGAA